MVFVLSPIELLCIILFRLLFALLAQVQHCNRLIHHVELYSFVQGAVRGERRKTVYFYQPRFNFVVDEDVEAQDF